jgi:hypothetical protein
MSAHTKVTRSTYELLLDQLRQELEDAMKKKEKEEEEEEKKKKEQNCNKNGQPCQF